MAESERPNETWDSYDLANSNPQMTATRKIILVFFRKNFNKSHSKSQILRGCVKLLSEKIFSSNAEGWGNRLNNPRNFRNAIEPLRDQGFLKEEGKSARTRYIATNSSLFDDYFKFEKNKRKIIEDIIAKKELKITDVGGEK